MSAFCFLSLICQIAIAKSAFLSAVCFFRLLLTIVLHYYCYFYYINGVHAIHFCLYKYLILNNVDIQLFSKCIKNISAIASQLPIIIWEILINWCYAKNIFPDIDSSLCSEWQGFCELQGGGKMQPPTAAASYPPLYNSYYCLSEQSEESHLIHYA